MNAARGNITWRLGDRRATAVRDYLVAKGINSARVRTVSYGKERPAVPDQMKRMGKEPARCHSSELSYIRL